MRAVKQVVKKIFQLFFSLFAQGYFSFDVSDPFELLLLCSGCAVLP